MASQDWERFGCWHTLLDHLCRQRGYADNGRLAADLCCALGRPGESGYLAAEKNVRDWRCGRRLPLRRNVVVLARLLEVEGDPVLSQRWAATYATARAADGPVTDEPDPVPLGAAQQGELAVVAARKAPRRVPWFAGLAALLILSLLAARPAPRPGVPIPAGLPTIAYNARAFLSVGTEKLIHGVVEHCAGGPADWSDVAPHLPESRTGHFSDGGLATQMMNGCGSELVVRAVKFTAARPGIEEVILLGTYFKIEVTGPLMAQE